MRLICPNCGAQYEVDVSVIPETGRDVQCSNCGHTWFQSHPDHERAESVEQENKEPQVDLDDDVSTDLPPEPEDVPDDEAYDGDEDVAEPTEERELTRRELDPSVAEILREEAARETAERAEEGGGLETQPDLGIDQAGENAAVRDRMARLRGLPDDDADDEEETSVAAVPVAAASTRKDLLPDIEEINSTLTASSDRHMDDEEEVEQRRTRSGFRRGFILAVVVFAVLALVYSYAPRIVDALPQAEPALSAYVDAVNDLRVWVDGLMQKAVERLTMLLSQLGTSDSG